MTDEEWEKLDEGARLLPPRCAPPQFDRWQTETHWVYAKAKSTDSNEGRPRTRWRDRLRALFARTRA